ncbi:hypothetical protein B0T17DRAFT_502610 [Bombardia bombarda]|uniref:Uncharacterized protein n=1 Tax=Bombardia bombarda TaxID=252184 RepID=A0AA39XJE7_9PEZI|nr:hypothetical protein B0T17DRAFT_502610 [Bombardia bombarda]
MQFQHQTLSACQTSSRVWVSSEEQLRTKYNKIRSSANHLGLSPSPFFPQTECEFVQLQARIKNADLEKLKAKICQKEADIKARRIPDQRVAPAPDVPVAALLGNRIGQDGLSPVLARPNPFNAAGSANTIPTCERVDWPCTAQFSQDGEGRVKQTDHSTILAQTCSGPTGRLLPVPRRNCVNFRLVSLATAFSEAEAHYDGHQQDVPWSLRLIVGDRWDLHMEMRNNGRGACGNTEQIAMEDAHEGIKGLIASMDKEMEI